MVTYFWIIFAGYFLSWMITFVNFESPKEYFWGWQKKILAASLLMHFGIVICYAARGSETVVRLLELAAPFLILVAAYALEWKTRIRFFMLFALPGALLVTLLVILHRQIKPDLHQWTESAFFWAHILFVLAGLAGFFLALFSALMYLLQSRQLKSKRPGNFFVKLPALDVLDRIHFRSLVWGDILFTLGILSGLFWATHLRELGPLFLDPKVLLSFLTCGVYWLIISLRLSSLRRGQKIVAGTLVAFGLMFATLAASYVMPSAYHRGL